MRTVDLAILGGGCAGLSLARDLASSEKKGASIPSTIVIEPRDTYANDRTWCFWERANQRNPLVEKSWSKWRFSSGKKYRVQESREWTYGCIPARNFYGDARNTIERSERVDLQLGLSVHSVSPEAQSLRIETSGGSVRARHIVDTRPPEPAHLKQSRLFQQFAGAEIECDLPIDHCDTVRLMDNMVVDDLGLRFDYVLPLSPTRLLVEATRFSASRVPPTQLKEDLDSTLDRIPPVGGYRIMRTEQGTIPMGLPPMSSPRDPRWVRAGTRGGAVRAASGYAFRRIQQWSSDCAQSLVNGHGPISQPNERSLQSRMDNLLLELLRDDPDLGPTIFLMLAQNVPADTLVRFLSDQGSHADLLTVIRALPPLPFLRQLANSAIQLPRRRPVFRKAA